jgi:hypothetical protein
VRFRILGPLEVHGSGDVPVPLRASKHPQADQVRNRLENLSLGNQPDALTRGAGRQPLPSAAIPRPGLTSPEHAAST